MKIHFNELIKSSGILNSFIGCMTFSYRINEISLLYLDDVRLFKPTADAGTILQIDSILTGFEIDSFPAELCDALKKIIIKDEKQVADFDFRNIETLTASKSFGGVSHSSINGSWFRNIHEWGKGMYPGENLRSETHEHWQHNINHIEGEGFQRNQPLRIVHYEWYNRYVAYNCGGSHHAAKVVYQARRDNLPYYRDALVEYLRINTKAVDELNRKFVSFIFITKNMNPDGACGGDTWFMKAMRDLVSDEIYNLSAVHYHQRIQFLFIPKESLKVHESLLFKWIDISYRAGKIILLSDYLKNPEKYHVRPYIHEVSSIFLGTPSHK